MKKSVNNNSEKQESVHMGHRQRMRNGIVQNGGFVGMADHEVLEYILSMAIPRKDTNPIAHKLINYFGSFSNVLDADVKDLVKIDGIGERTAVFLNSFQHILKRYKEDKATSIKVLSNSKQVREYIGERIRFLPIEECYAIFLNSSFAIINSKKIGLSGNDKVLFEAKTIVEQALAVKAAGVILAHNHPSGNSEPSLDDKKVTEQLYLKLKIMGIELIDHYIYANSSEFSFKNSGEIAKYEEKYKDINLVGGFKENKFKV